MLNLTYIIPLHTFNADVKKYLTRALDSLAKLDYDYEDTCTLMFVGDEKTLSKCEEVYNKLGITMPLTKVINSNTDVFEQINTGALNCLTEYFSVLEFDDMVTPQWLRCAEEWITNQTKSSVYLPFVEMCDTDGKRLYLCNELGWSPSYVEEHLGLLDEKTIKAFKGFMLSGAIINTEDFISAHTLKPSLKVAAWYEFLLRLCYKNFRVYVIPKIGYRHTVGRKDSYDKIMENTITANEGEWLIKTAEEEYFFDEDRKLTYPETNETDVEVTK